MIQEQIAESRMQSAMEPETIQNNGAFRNAFGFEQTSMSEKGADVKSNKL